MDKQEFKNMIEQIGTCEDEVQRRTLLADMSEAMEKVFDESSVLTTQNTSLTADNEKLREANMKLFLKIGDNKTPEQQQKDLTGVENPPEKRKFENLFNDKGGLK